MKRNAKRFVAVFAAIIMVAGILPVNLGGLTVAKAATEIKLNATDLSEGNISANKEVNGFTLTAGSTVDANTKTLESGIEVTRRLKLNGAGSFTSRSIVFKTTDAAKVSAYFMSSGDSVRSLALYKDDGTLISEQPAKVGGTILEEQTYEIEEAGTYYLASTASGINVYYVSVAEGELEQIVRDPWSSVMTPSLTSAVAEDGTITVSANMKIGSRLADACDKLDIIMSDKNGKEVARESIAKKGDTATAVFTPTASGTYSFTSEASRKDEQDVKKSNEISADFTLPLATPDVRAMTENNNGQMKVIWSSVPEAESYDVYSKTGSEEYKLLSNVKADSTGKELSYSAPMTKGTKYDFKVVAKRGDDESEPGEALGCLVRNEAERDWVAARFGTSTSDEANRIEGNIYDGLKIFSCTSKADGKIDKKGGKLNASDPYDGISYYYTKIDPKKENFEISGTFTIDYLNPTPDGQEGFAIIVRDSVGENGVNSSAFYTNSATFIASKVQYTNEDGATKSIKDGIGYRFFSGVTSTTETPKTGQVVMSSGAFDTKLQIKKGDSYTFRVKMDNTGYRVIYKDADGNENIQTLYGKDELLKIDKDNVYVGFAAARGCNVTVKDITFTTSDPATDAPDEGKPVEKVASNYKISSASTSGSKTYNLTFSANADGKVTIKKGSKTVVKETAVKAGEDLVAEVKLSSGENKFKAVFTPDANYKPGDNMEMESYDKATIEKTVTCKSYGNPGEKIIVSPEGTAEGKGTEASPLDLKTAVAYVQPGQQIICKAGTYELTEGIKIEDGIDGTSENRIYLLSDPAETKNTAVFDFKGQGKGLVLWGDYWYIKGISVTNTADGQKGIQVAGNNNVLELVKAYKNGNTGIQVSGQSTDPASKWPKNNLILNCTSFDNSDAAMEDADGFAAKLTTGEGNVFYGCIAYNNADDGWDCFAKTATGPIGAVKVINSIAYKNGYLSNGKEAGNGNGFKMGGSALSGHHVVMNSFAYDNKAKGFDSNSCPDIEVYDCTAYNNGSYNYALYSNNGIDTAFKAERNVSFKDTKADVVEQLKLTASNEKDLKENYFWNEIAAANAQAKKGNTPNADWFRNLKTGSLPARNDDGTIKMGTLLKLSASAPKGVGADFDNSKYAMETVLAEFNVSRDIPEAGELTAVKGGSSPVGIIVVVILVVVAAGAGVVFYTKKKKIGNGAA